MSRVERLKVVCRVKKLVSLYSFISAGTPSVEDKTLTEAMVSVTDELWYDGNKMKY